MSPQDQRNSKCKPPVQFCTEKANISPKDARACGPVTLAVKICPGQYTLEHD